LLHGVVVVAFHHRMKACKNSMKIVRFLMDKYMNNKNLHSFTRMLKAAQYNFFPRLENKHNFFELPKKPTQWTCLHCIDPLFWGYCTLPCSNNGKKAYPLEFGFTDWNTTRMPVYLILYWHAIHLGSTKIGISNSHLYNIMHAPRLFSSERESALIQSADTMEAIQLLRRKWKCCAQKGTVESLSYP